MLETSTVCNIECSFCRKNKYYSDDLKKKPSFMTLEGVKKKVNKNSNYEWVSLFNNGEFFLNPQWKEIFTYIVSTVYYSSSIKSVLLATNVTLLDHEKVDFILNKLKKYPVAFTMILSINAFKRETYKKIVGRDLRDSVYNNARNFIYKAVIHNKIYKNIIVFTQIVVMPINQNELESFIKYWQNVYKENGVDYYLCEDMAAIKNKYYLITLKRLITGKKSDTSFYLSTIKNLQKKFKIKINRNVESGENYFKRRVCFMLFNSPLISEKKQGVCFHDSHYKYAYPEKESLKKIVHNKYKTNHYLGFFHDPEICDYCLNYSALNMKKAEELAPTVKVFKMYEKRLNKGIPFEFYNVGYKTSEDKKKLIKFLNKNNYYSLFSNSELKSDNILYMGKNSLKKKKSEHFCAAWLTNLKFKNNSIYSGCEKINIEIKDFNQFQKKLHNNDLSSIPFECLLCENKFVFNELYDCYRLFQTDSFYSPLMPGVETMELFYEVEQKVKENKLEQACNLAKGANNIYPLLKIINSATFYRIYSNSLLNLIKENMDIFILFKYLKSCNPDIYKLNELILKSQNKIFIKIFIFKLIQLIKLEKLYSHKIIEKSENVIFNAFINCKFKEIKVSDLKNNEDVFEKILMKRIEKLFLQKKEKEIFKLYKNNPVLINYKNIEKYLKHFDIQKIFDLLLDENFNFKNKDIVMKNTGEKYILKIKENHMKKLNHFINNIFPALLKHKKTNLIDYFTEKILIHNSSIKIYKKIYKILKKYKNKEEIIAFFKPKLNYLILNAEINNFDTETLKICEDISKKVFVDKIFDLIKKEKFYTVIKILEKYPSLFNNIRNFILNSDMDKINSKQIKFLISTAYKNNDDNFFFMIYSYYMKKNKFNYARRYFEKITHKNPFFTEEERKKTKLFLDKKNKNVFSKIKSIFKWAP
ncbi:MAG: radical SAM protein [Candidatus Muiribacteriota bacterium]